MLKKIRFKNFKCFEDTGNIDIRPLTFLVGPNSSGKSSIIQMLLMLKQTVDSIDVDNPLNPNEKYIQMGGYPEFVFKHDIKRDIEIYLEFLNNMPRPKKKTTHISIKASFYYNRKTTKIMLRNRDVILDNNIIEKVQRDIKKKKYKSTLLYTEKNEKKEIVFDRIEPIKFFGTRPVYSNKLIKESKEYYPSGDIYFITNYMIANEFSNIYYLGPLREYPKRFYVTSGISPKDVGIRGEYSVDVLWLAHRSKGKKLDIIEEVNHWFKEFNIAKNLRLAPVGKTHYYYYIVEIIDKATGVVTNIADVGFGASQALPIIIESFYAPPESIILIEQPEIHLHPKAQSILGDLFLKAVSEGNKTFIIETHSEHILDRIRRRIAEKKISKDKIAIYYFEPSEGGTKIQEVTINEHGQFEKFPEGFFEEGYIEALEHLKALK